ncbi:MAG: hypothetical protein JWO03_2883, partial [Bacteroidetes bacterium]|nr:hypothetical protein [Bacteroidota bacterium]
ANYHSSYMKSTKKQIGEIKADESNVALMCLITFFQNTTDVTGTPGMNQHYWAPVSYFDVDGIPDPPATGVTAGATAIAASTGFVFLTGKGFINLRNDLQKGSELDFKSVGDPSAPGIHTEAKGRTLGLSPQLVEFFTNAKGVPGILLCKDTKCTANEYWVVGCDCNPAFMSFEFKSGTKGGNDAKGSMYTFTSECGPYMITITNSDLALLMLP